MSMHRVNRLEIRVEVASDRDAEALQDRLGTLCQDILPARLSEIADTVCAGGKTIRLDRLDLDLGDMGTVEFEGTVLSRFTVALEDALIKAAYEQDRDGLTASAATAMLPAQLSEALQFGQAHWSNGDHWNSGTTGQGLDDLIRAALRESPAQLEAVLARLGFGGAVRERLSQGLSADTFDGLMDFLERQDAGALRKLAADLRNRPDGRDAMVDAAAMAGTGPLAAVPDLPEILRDWLMTRHLPQAPQALWQALRAIWPHSPGRAAVLARMTPEMAATLLEAVGRDAKGATPRANADRSLGEVTAATGAEPSLHDGPDQDPIVRLNRALAAKWSEHAISLHPEDIIARKGRARGAAVRAGIDSLAWVHALTDAEARAMAGLLRWAEVADRTALVAILTPDAAEALLQRMCPDMAGLLVSLVRSAAGDTAPFTGHKPLWSAALAVAADPRKRATAATCIAAFMEQAAAALSVDVTHLQRQLAATAAARSSGDDRFAVVVGLLDAGASDARGMTEESPVLQAAFADMMAARSAPPGAVERLVADALTGDGEGDWARSAEVTAILKALQDEPIWRYRFAARLSAATRAAILRRAPDVASATERLRAELAGVRVADKGADGATGGELQAPLGAQKTQPADRVQEDGHGAGAQRDGAVPTNMAETGLEGLRGGRHDSGQPAALMGEQGAGTAAAEGPGSVSTDTEKRDPHGNTAKQGVSSGDLGEMRDAPTPADNAGARGPKVQGLSGEAGDARAPNAGQGDGSGSVSDADTGMCDPGGGPAGPTDASAMAHGSDNGQATDPDDVLGLLAAGLGLQRLAESLQPGAAATVAGVTPPSALSALRTEFALLREAESATTDAARTAQSDVVFDWAGAHIYTDTAGLVLYWPHLERLFMRAELMRDRAFVSAAAHRKAVALLQFLADGDGAAAEHRLGLAKLLCGLDLAYPIARLPALSDDETALATSLTGAVMASWPAMANTSEDGFRETFICRQGVLKRDVESEQMVLHVEAAPFDMLLDQYPVALSHVRLPWMAEGVRVRWR